MKSYEINKNTMAIIYSNGGSLIYEDGETFIVDINPIKIIKDSCEFFGSSFEGRKIGTTNLIGITHKVPIIIEESNELIFFPTSSPRLYDCCWISLKHINKYGCSKKGTFIEFKNGVIIDLEVSYGIIDNQILRATRLNLILKDRKVNL